MDEPKKVLKRILYFVIVLVIMALFLIAAFLTAGAIQSKLVHNAVREKLDTEYQTLEVFTSRKDKLCVVLDEDGKYSLYSVEGDHKDIKLVLLWYDMNIGDKYITPSCTEEYSFASRLYDNKEAVPETAYKTVELKTENTTVYFCVEHFIFGNVID